MYRYITRSYAEWLGLESTAHVIHDDGMYEMEDDGLAYRLTEVHTVWPTENGETWSAWVAA
jgi:hypothetical protein